MAAITISTQKCACPWNAPFTRVEFIRLVQAGLAVIGMPQAWLELLLLDDEHMAQLQAQTMGLPGPTNVLSFPFIATAAASPVLGAAPTQSHPLATGNALPPMAALAKDTSAPTCAISACIGSLALSLDTLHRECLLYAQPPKVHCITLIAHGIAHLAGYDHGPDMDTMCHIIEQAAAAAVR